MADQPEKSSASPSRLPAYLVAIFIFVLSILSYFQFFYAHLFLGLDNSWHDKLFRLRGMQPADPRVTIAMIDDETLKKIDKFPPPRSMYASLLDRLLNRYGAKVVGLDII